MFVQRGQDWQDGDSDGGLGSIGVICNLDPDALYTQVVWPLQSSAAIAEPVCCRIGAGNKFELQVGPTPIKDFVTGTQEPMTTGVLWNSSNISTHSVGKLVNNNCMVVDVLQQGDQNLVLVAPLERISIPTIPAAPVVTPAVPPRLARKPKGIPEYWQPSESILVEVTDIDEKSEIIEQFHSTEGGMDIQAELWNVYAVCREEVASEHWGIANEERLFIGTGTKSPEALLRDCPGEFYQKCSYGGRDLASRVICFSALSLWADHTGHRQATGERQIVLSQVALGRVRDQQSENRVPPHLITAQLAYHSEKKLVPTLRPPVELLSIRNPSQAVPEYIITYKQLQGPLRRIISARRPQEVNSSSSRGAAPRRRHEASNGRTKSVRPQQQGTSISSVARRPSAPVDAKAAKQTSEGEDRTKQ